MIRSIPQLARASFVILVAGLLLGAAAPRAGAETVVSLTFDDGAVNQLAAKDLLAANRVRGTFYVNSGFVGSNAYYMTWDQIAGVAAAGNEIGGHTLTHRRLTDLRSSQRRTEICDDRASLVAHGFDPVSFAYPFGAYNGDVQAIVEDCGYSSARRVGGLSHTGCGTCRDAETIPPGDPYALRSNAAGTGPMTVAELQGYVTQAEAAGGGWVPLTFHDICDCPAVDDSLSPSDLGAFLGWLRARAPGTVVKSVRGVMGFPEPPLPSEEAPQPVSAFAAPVRDSSTALASLRVRKRQRLARLFVLASMAEPGTLSARGVVKLRGIRFHFRKVAVAAVPGKVVKLRLRLTRKGKRAVARALRRHRGLRALVTVTAKDAAGNTKAATRKVTLRR